MKAPRVLSMTPHKVPLAGAVAAIDAGKSTGPSPDSSGNKSDPNQGDAAMKSSAPGYQSTNDVNALNRKSSGNAATAGQSTAPRKTPNCT
jgi:hypothetical protein